MRRRLDAHLTALLIISAFWNAACGDRSRDRVIHDLGDLSPWATQTSNARRAAFGCVYGPGYWRTHMSRADEFIIPFNETCPDDGGECVNESIPPYNTEDEVPWGDTKVPWPKPRSLGIAGDLEDMTYCGITLAEIMWYDPANNAEIGVEGDNEFGPIYLDGEPERDASGAPAGDYWWILMQNLLTAHLNFNNGAGGGEAEAEVFAAIAEANALVAECHIGVRNSNYDCNDQQGDCGNGVLDAGEECDDNNFVDGDGCDYNCTLTACGNGVGTAGEECDDGDGQDGYFYNCGGWGCTASGQGCNNDCTRSRCGDGFLNPQYDGGTLGGGICDDGNLVDGDGCDSNCTFTACGNGIVTAGEACDDGNFDDLDGCLSDCTAPTCGDTVVDLGEECDDGNAVDGDGCDSNCTLTACGNHVVTAGETCDDGNTENADGCDNNCTPTGCGNGIYTPQVGEGCDDGNDVDGDGCTNACVSERSCPRGVFEGLDSDQAPHGRALWLSAILDYYNDPNDNSDECEDDTCDYDGDLYWEAPAFPGDYPDHVNSDFDDADADGDGIDDASDPFVRPFESMRAGPPNCPEPPLDY